MNEPKTQLHTRRQWMRKASAGAVLSALGGGIYVLLDDQANAQARSLKRADGKPRLPPGQRLISALRPMGGQEGNPSPSSFRLQVHGEVKRPFTLDFRGLLAAPQRAIQADVHCVTGWSVLGSRWTGVRIADLAKRAGLKASARYLIVEAANGYTANMPLRHALREDALIAHRHNGKRLARAHGSPVRALVPDLYFWKSAKWLTGLRFSSRDLPGYWETRGYHNRGDPWKEERYG
jgi:DMSO/TMAO reductase YedYZ molybdopterin-dependent catalytic subunit